MSDANKSSKIPGASDDLLEELRAKTAALARSVKGRNEPEQRHLAIDENAPKNKNVEEDLSLEQPPQLSELKENQNANSTGINPAVELVRRKVSKYYQDEPDAGTELLEAEAAGEHRSKHQQFMYDLSTSGKSLADVQTEWHNYYVALPDDEKHSVWQEFYQMQSTASAYAKKQSAQEPKKPAVSHAPASTQSMSPDPRSRSNIKSQLMDKVSAGGKLKPVHHFKSLLFGLGLASAVGLIIVFLFFNEVFIAPFISPSQNVSASPIIGPASSENVGPESKIIIPKINVEVPVVFDLGSIEEQDIQTALEDGVVHYATTPNPGEIGNSVIVGHSSNNILNSGKYKFAFVLLKRLEPDDLFYVQHKGVRYTYKVYREETVPPTAVEVLDPQERANTITLITCDPPGTSINRHIIVAEQIDPDPSGNSESTAPDRSEVTGGENEELPSNAPSLWSRLWPF